MDRAWVCELLERFELDPTRPAGELSTGNRRKVGLVQAFMSRPELLLLDEPSSGAVVAQRYLALVAMLGGLALVFAVALVVLALPFGALDGVSLPGLTAASAGVFGLALLHAASPSPSALPPGAGPGPWPLPPRWPSPGTCSTACSG